MLLLTIEKSRLQMAFLSLQRVFLYSQLLFHCFCDFLYDSKTAN
jgi:hypothetical protein